MTEEKGFIGRFDAIVRESGERIFASYNGQPLTFSELGRSANALAANLRALGLQPGDRVAVMLRNSVNALAVMFGLAKAGLVWVPINVQQRGEGLRYILEHAEPQVVLVESDLEAMIQGCGANLPRVILAGSGAAGSLEDILAASADFDQKPPSPNDCFGILYTSGTTGAPKGVMVSHRMLRLAGESVALVSAAKDSDRFFVWEPLYHVGGAQLIILPLIRNVSLAMVDRFSASAFWRQVKETGSTHIHFLGGILQILLKQPPSPLDRSHGARIAWGGGCPKEVWEPFEERFGIAIRECYGMTEASSITTYTEMRAVGTVGKAVPWFAVEIQDDKDQVLPAGQIGQIVVRPLKGDGISEGYFRNPEATAKTMRDSLLYTGDLGYINEQGNLVFLGRMTDSVRCKGENVSAWEVERVAGSHPDIADCAMVGVAADIGEQDIKLYIQPREGAAIDLRAYSKWLEERLASYQRPRYIAVVDSFERTPSQRIMKHKLSKETSGIWDRLKEGSTVVSARNA